MVLNSTRPHVVIRDQLIQKPLLWAKLLALIIFYIIKELVPGKSRSKKRKIHNSNILGGNFLEAIFFTEFLNRIFLMKSYLPESTLIDREREREKEREKERERKRERKKERERERDSERERELKIQNRGRGGTHARHG
jgi:hypothetical protein